MNFFPNKNNESAVFPKDEDSQNAFKAARGDKTAFETLVRKYEKFVCTTVYSVVKNYDDSYDVAQETFLKLYHNIGSFKGESSFSSWLFRIAKNCALDFLRKEKNTRKNISLTTQTPDGEETELEIPDASEKSNPESSMLKSEQKQVLYEALEKLSDSHKEIIILRDIDGYSYEEIAEMQGLEPGTVKSRLFRARDSLRKILLEKNYF